MKPPNFCLPAAQLAGLRARVAETGLSRNEIMRRVIGAWLALPRPSHARLPDSDQSRPDRRQSGATHKRKSPSREMSVRRAWKIAAAKSGYASIRNTMCNIPLPSAKSYGRATAHATNTPHCAPAATSLPFVSTHFWLPRAQIDGLRALSTAVGLSQSAIARRVLGAWFTVGGSGREDSRNRRQYTLARCT
jgi:hypothetical protein